MKDRIIEYSKEHGRSHLGSALSSVDIINSIYQVKKPDEPFVLSAGHCFLAQMVVLEKRGVVLPDEIPTHPEVGMPDVIVPTGSLGHGLPIALGMALSDRTKNVYCMISDGECDEGSVWETFNIMVNEKANNLKVVLNANGVSAYKEIDTDRLIKKIQGFGLDTPVINGHDPRELYQTISEETERPRVVVAKTTVEHHPELKGIDAHYKILK